MCKRSLFLNPSWRQNLKISSLAQVTYNYVKWGLLLPNPVICQQNADVSKTLLDSGCRILILQMLLSVLTFVLSFKYTSFVVTEERMGG